VPKVSQIDQPCRNRRAGNATVRAVVFAGASLMLGTALTGCGLIVRSLGRSARNAAQPPPVSIQAYMKNDMPIANLSMYPNGPGIIVCTPVAPEGLHNFAEGVGGWLNLEVGGQPQFSRSPALGNLRHAGVELHAPDLALESPARAGRLVRILGVGYAAIGTLAGTANSGKLTYRLYRLSDGKAVGQPIATQGTEDQIASQLPALAAQMTRRLKLGHVDIPAAVNLTGYDLEFLGHISLSDDIWSLTSSQQDRLRQLAPRSPFAALLQVRAVRFIPAAVQSASDQLLAEAPTNSLALSEVGWDAADALIPHADLVTKNRNAFPENYLYALTAVWLYRASKQPLLERKAAETTVQCAYETPDAWLTLGYTINNEADSVRQAKPFDDLTADEKAFVTNLYPDWVSCSAHATRLDPFYGKAWLRLCMSSCFEGDDSTADTAFWKAAQLDDEKADVYEWGLQMYQPKWLDDRQKLSTVAQMAASANYTSQSDVDRVETALDEAGFSDQKSALANKYGNSSLSDH
jgi:hypothetical protein